MHKTKNLFLQQSYHDAWTDYEKTLIKKRIIKWDYIILTASNEEQAEAYRMQINQRLAKGFLSSVGTHYAVLSDPEGKRVGSGGATLNVLRYIREQSQDKNVFSDKRILVIHSGGDSKRVPQYSACGKLFSPVPRQLPDGRQSTLFDEVIIGMSGVPARLQNGLLVLSGDVLLLFNSLQIDFQLDGAAAISIKEHVSTGKNHGVFLSDGNGNVENFLHKFSEEDLRRIGAVNDQDSVNLDTGAILFDKNILSDLFSLISTEGNNDDDKFKCFVNEKTRLSFYGDFLYPLAAKSTLDQYMEEKPEGEFCEELLFCRKAIWEKLHSYTMKLICLSPAEFIHFGTTHELLSLLTKDIDNYEFLGWKRQTCSICNNKQYASINSWVESEVTIHENSYIEDSCLSGNCNINSGCVVSNVILDNVDVPEDIVLHGVILKDGKFVVRVYGVGDNPKNVFSNGATLLSKNMESLLKSHQINTNDIWQNSDSFDLWTANLYPVCETMQEAVKWAVWLCQIMLGDETDKKAVQQYLSTERLSLCSSFNSADLQEIEKYRDAISDKIKVQSFLDCLQGQSDVQTANEVFGKNGISKFQKQLLIQIADEAKFSLKIRIYYYLSKITTGTESEELETLCFQAISDGICKETSIPCDSNTLHIAKDNVEVHLPVRINWGGGWSDTPPYCNENGGTVLNVAIKLNGKEPIVVKMKRLHSFEIVLASEDSGAVQTFTDMKDLQRCSDPFDPFALHKAALITCGIISKDNACSVEQLTKAIGGGFYLSTNVVEIPRGSGLGTSSILAGACIKAIHEFFDMEISEKILFSEVMCMEQLMSTGGGWQDQVGGLVPGIKFITSKPAISQDICVENVSVSQTTLAELNERIALIYTGQRRLARNILRDVVGKYIGANQNSLDALYKIRQLAVLMKFELEKGNVDKFAELLDLHWEQSKRLDKGCTNTCIDHIFMSCQDMLSAKMICGAGGGGFLQVILKKEYTKEDLKHRLYSVFQESGVDVWDCEIT